MAADRFVLKQFAGSATNNGAFGAAQATGAGVQPVADIKDVQSLNAFEQGWNAATLTADKLPALEEMQGLEALLCKSLKENYSEGIPFWIAGETYFQYSFVNYNGVLYYNTTGSYTNNNPAIDTANWAAYNKVGTATVGTDDTPIYLNVGTPTAGKRMGVVAYDNTKTYNLDDVVLTVESDGSVILYLSLAENNTSALTDDTKWKQVFLGGGGGGEIGDMGFAPLGINESLNLRRYLNGQVISQTQFKAFTNKVKSAIALYPNLAATETNWQAEKTNSKLGQCGKFVIDDTAGTIRLPAVVNAQGLADLALIGMLKSESLPNLTGNACVVPQNNLVPSGVFARSDKTIGAWGGSGTTAKALDFNASRSSSTYQDNAPVQQEAVQYPYYIQVATGVEETLPAIREYKINTPFFFGQSMYSDVAPDNASWLASNGQYNARSVYPDYYDWLLEQMNAGVSGFVASTSAYTDYDFVINTADQTFRLPLKNGQEGVFADNTVPSGWNLYYYVGDTVQDASLINAGAVLGQLATKTNFVEAAAASMPSGRYIDLTLGASGSTYTAPANGWVYCTGKTTASSCYISVDIPNTFCGINGTGANQDLTTNQIAVEAGTVFEVRYGNVTLTMLRFVYAQGDQ